MNQEDQKTFKANFDAAAKSVFLRPKTTVPEPSDQPQFVSLQPDNMVPDTLVSVATEMPELDDGLREILGRPNFACMHIAKWLRRDGFQIASRSEDEQATVIHWLLGFYLQYGAEHWKEAAEDALQAIMDNYAMRGRQDKSPSSELLSP